MVPHNPPHPGEVLRELYQSGSGMSLTELSLRLGVSRKTLSLLVNGHQGMSADMAIKLENVFPTTPARIWLGLQLEYDLHEARQRTENNSGQ